MPEIIVHMLNDKKDGIEGIVQSAGYYPPPRMGPNQDLIVELILSWNRDANRCGAFKINVGPVAADETRHFDLVLHPDIPLPIPEVPARFFGGQIGLRPWNGAQPDPNAEVCWGGSDQPPRYVTGTGTPYDTRQRDEWIEDGPASGHP
ncbi:MAG: hypothetical protein UX65_C0014G0012 [Parcubacteria group bacterium GW2011_GWB1_46_8]|nr:MAG: hypothetical protein UX14_C0017G0014 [Parcubacteria group bacterium GW2011_GWF1_45_5]KKU43239.1 MAG: hypothetical protein UX61_C0026G0013 [Parcubacteria group bacterium GW2011_GWA2_46_7]KKU45945.1 MAG: hypothetical protein UX65_C0014G0012 [Parcubacteria group bacterium GW2011_GWB1_46_8]